MGSLSHLTLAVNWSSILTGTLLVLFLLASVLLILVVLIQKPQGGGLAGAFGSGAGSGQTAFGARTGDALTVATISFFVFYLMSAVALTYFMKPQAAEATLPALTEPSTPVTPVPSTPAPAGEPTPTPEAPKAETAAPATTPPSTPAPQAPAEQPKADPNAPAPKG